MVAVVQVPVEVPVDPLHRGSLASSQARIPGSDLYLPTNALIYFLKAAFTVASV